MMLKELHFEALSHIQTGAEWCVYVEGMCVCGGVWRGVCVGMYVEGVCMWSVCMWRGVCGGCVCGGVYVEGVWKVYVGGCMWEGVCGRVMFTSIVPPAPELLQAYLQLMFAVSGHSLE